MSEDHRVSCIRHTENIGLPAISEFEAYQKARGTYIAFMFDDNEWESDAVEQMVDYAQRYNIKALAGQYMLFQGRPGSSYDEPSNWSVIGGKNINVCDLMISNRFGNGSVLLHRDTIERVGFLDPNIALSRCWDWDLWQRVAKEFRFEMVDIMIGREKGTGLEDSLGNTHQLYQWAAQERMHQPRNKELLAENYLECDVFDLFAASSPFLYRSNCWIVRQYEQKTWFNINDASLRAIKEKSVEPWNGKRIVYLTASPTVNASSTLNWGRLPYSESYVLYYSSIYYFDYQNWILADAIIIERDLTPSIDQILIWAERMEIPCYYYIDDNFIVLAKDYAKTYLKDNMKQLAKGTTLKSISRFRGIFCSTPELKEYFNKQNLHKNITLMEPVYLKEYVQSYHKLEDDVKIAFFGNSIRGEVLIDIVYPALESISETRKIHLHLPDETFIGLIEHLCKDNDELKERVDQAMKMHSVNEIQVREHLVLHSFPRTLSLELALKRFAEIGIQIQIHCGPIIDNNRYKTVNALLNAVCLGAVLVATDDSPYSSIEYNGITCLLAPNTEKAWEIALQKALNPQFHYTIYQNALSYCQTQFNVTKGVESLVHAMDDVPSYNFIDLNKRLLKYAESLNAIIGQLSASRGNTFNTTNTVITQEALSATLFLNSLSNYSLTKALKAAIPGWSPGSRGIEKILPLRLSKPLVAGDYIGSKLPRAKKIKLVIVSNVSCPVLFEFISENRIIKQELVNIAGICQKTLDVPQSIAPVRILIANHHPSSSVYVLQRHFFNKSIIDVFVEEGGKNE